MVESKYYGLAKIVEQDAELTTGDKGWRDWSATRTEENACERGVGERRGFDAKGKEKLARIK